MDLKMSWYQLKKHDSVREDVRQTLMESHGFKLLEFNNNTYYIADHAAVKIKKKQWASKVM